MVMKSCMKRNIRISKFKYSSNEEIASAISNFEEYIKNETLALSIEKVEDDTLEVFDLNGHETGIKVIRK